MTKKLRIALAQLNLVVGDIQGNKEKHLRAAARARDEFAADVIVFSELSLTGYPPEDLLLRPAFLQETHTALQQLTQDIQGIYCVIGHPHLTAQGLYNACSLIYNGHLEGQYAKQLLPNYGVFDEDRYFIADNKPCVVSIHGVPVGLVICEDLWQEGPVEQAVKAGARLILSPNASPFEVKKPEERQRILSPRAKQNKTPIVYVNNVGGQDELVFDGGSMIVDETGNIAKLAPFFEEALMPVEIEVTDTRTQIAIQPISLPTQEERVYSALVLSLRDYINKNRFPGVLVGLSGGIDSALVLTLAVDALGKDRVKAIMMPSRFTADISKEDSEKLIAALGVQSETISIEPTYKSLLESLAPSFAGKKVDTTEENMQARCRAIILMALSNKYGHLVLTTGNRSEIAVGYCTLYGDMAGGFAPLRDLPKTGVYQLAHYRNRLQPLIPTRTLERAPTAELAANQKDEDSLPPYSLLDTILDYYLNQGLGLTDIVAKGFASETVSKVIDLIHKSEYKRKQAAIGPRINEKSFGKDWRYPVTNGFKG